MSRGYRAPLTWYRRDAGSASHPKVLELITMRDGFRSYYVWDSSIGYAVEHGTDGLIRASVLPLLMGRKVDADRLVKVGLWDEDPDGWRVHDFADYQQIAQVSAQIRETKQRAARLGNCKRWHPPGCDCAKRNGLRGIP